VDTEDPDRPLVEAWRSGDNRAGHELFKRHFDDINGFIRRNVSDGSVEDLVQETFLQCQRSLANFAGKHTFRAYLYGIARNVFFDHLRRRHRRERLQDMLERTLEELGASPLLMIAERQEVVLFGHALRRIPLDTQVLFQLHFWEKLPASALAEIYAAPVRVRDVGRPGAQARPAAHPRLTRRAHAGASAGSGTHSAAATPSRTVRITSPLFGSSRSRRLASPCAWARATEQPWPSAP
jgi:RNA polymerase sigma-70 factor (ECF subfamily)